MEFNVINQQTLYLLKDPDDDDNDLIIRFIEEYLNNTPSRIVKIKTSIQNNEHDTLKVLAHTIKSTSATIGANTLSSIASKLEASPVDQELQLGLYMNLHKSYQAVEAELLSIKKEILQDKE